MQIIREAKKRNVRKVLAESNENNHVGVCNGGQQSIRLEIEGPDHHFMIKLDADTVSRIKTLSDEAS